ncbi:MAG: class I SAM-dependent methyltransferase [Rhizobium rhizophilum]|uniref:class I SAM-dependent methyltransferase n=1 Tax=Rhizobium rhizophilum TaxID=1850373 RepID=UPI00391A5348
MSGQSWLDVGAGHGEIASILASRHLEGTAIDIGPRPHGLAKAVDYHGVDINKNSWHQNAGGKYDTVYAIAVWEHLLRPDLFAEECLRLVKRRGCLILVCPDYGSLARKLLGSRWPYFEPGEHISIPSRLGARRCLERKVAELGVAATIQVGRLNVCYSVKYLAEVLRLTFASNFIPSNFSLPMPTGLLFAKVNLD